MDGHVGTCMELDEIAQNLLGYASTLINAVSARASVASVGKAYNDLSRHYRAMGICGVLLTGDKDIFFHCLIQSALTRKYYLQRSFDEGLFNEPSRKASFIDPFLDAVAANQWKLAKEIAALSPTQWLEGYEYEDDYLYAIFLHDIIDYDPIKQESLARQLERFETVLEGASSVRLEICKSLLHSDKSIFDSAFSDLLAGHEEITSRIADPKLDSIMAQESTFEPNRRINVEALAILRIADKRGIETDCEYKYCPSLVRNITYSTFVPISFPNLRLDE